MQRRQFLQGVLATAGLATTQALWAHVAPASAPTPELDPKAMMRMQEKIENYDANFSDDIYWPQDSMPLLKAVQKKLYRAQDIVGYAGFNLLSFDELLKVGAAHAKVGAFTAEEVQLIEELFFFDAKLYGFYGEKVTTSLTSSLREKDAVKVPRSGHYVFRGRPQELYKKIVKDVGHEIVLTSGIRSVVKQLALFLTKAIQCQGNLSRASRSLAPPGHSFHGISDFDVGKVGGGYHNFTDQFAQTDVFKRLTDLGYVDLRYKKINSFGVRFEPWHIMVTG